MASAVAFEVGNDKEPEPSRGSGGSEEGDGAGEYPLVDEVLGAADDAAAVAAIKAVLEDPNTGSGARFWATLFSVSFVRKELIASLETSLKYANDDLIELTKEQIEMFKQLT